MKQLVAAAVFMGISLACLYGAAQLRRQAIIDRCPAGTDVAVCFQQADAEEAAKKAQEAAAASARKRAEAERLARLAQARYEDLDAKGRMDKFAEGILIPATYVAVVLGVALLLVTFTIRWLNPR